MINSGPISFRSLVDDLGEYAEGFAIEGDEVLPLSKPQALRVIAEAWGFLNLLASRVEELDRERMAAWSPTGDLTRYDTLTEVMIALSEIPMGDDSAQSMAHDNWLDLHDEDDE